MQDTTVAAHCAGKAEFLNALAGLVEVKGHEVADTVPVLPTMLGFSVAKTPFAWIAEALNELDAPPKGGSIGDVITAMGLTTYVSRGRDQRVGGKFARIQFANVLGGSDNGPTMTGLQVANRLRYICSVLPPAD